jgi:phosphopantetheine adenylyltransferase/dephospho-CoA kinase
VPITDPFGPSIVDTDLDCIVASGETLNGALAVNDRRTLNALASLHVYAIQLIDDERTVTSEECKVSSWKCRRALLGTLLRPVQRAKHAHTYVIGLTGGIASGKTHIADYCRQLGMCTCCVVWYTGVYESGAHVIDCDRLGHDVYTVDTECYAKLINEFGTSIVELTTRAIDRRALGKIVFADKAVRVCE